MSSVDRGAEAGGSRTPTLGRLLDPAFGLFVFAAHLLAVYVPTAVACQVGLGGAGEAVRASYQTGLALFTVAVAAIIVLHAFLRYRRFRDLPDKRFRLTLTVGCDALATVAVLWQLFPILLTPLCA